MNKKVFAFDLGKASIGYCVREDLKILEAGSLIINKDHAECISNRDRRRVQKTLLAHKKRESFFNKLWQNCDLNILNKDDKRFSTEFGKKNNSTIYNSTLLRIALIQNKPLEEWQIYKALHNAIQRRGYDSKLPWANAKSDDDRKNEELSARYTQNEQGEELIQNENFKYPCYYDAVRLNLWSENMPEKLQTYVPLDNVKKIRDAGIVAPRNLVEKELKQLYINAQLQLPQLNKYSVEYFLYGEGEVAYASYNKKDYKCHRGTEWDMQGVLGQKIPRFDNRIIAKCKLLPKRNVCKANTLENVSFVLLMKLKNLRYTNINNEYSMLSADTINKIYQNWLNKALKDDGSYKLDTTIIQKEVEKVLGEKIQDKFEPLKANISGRSSFCRRACKIMNHIILNGIEDPSTMDVAEFTDNIDTPNGITEAEIRTMLSKIGTWENLYIPDNRYEMAELSSDNREKTDILIGNITNPIVRNRLQVFRDKLIELKQKYETPDKIIFEFIRDGADNSLYGAKKAQDFLKTIKENEKTNNDLAIELKNANCFSVVNLEKLKLLKQQDGICIYCGQRIGISDLDKCEIDHIYPRSRGGNDAISNKVLCYSIENQKKKDRTPYEWLHNDERTWADFVNRAKLLKDKLKKTKYTLLTSKPENCEELIKSYNGLAETAQIARVAQDITAFIFGWGLQLKDEKRRIFVNNGASTSGIRKTYRLNKLLGNDVKKNRSNDKHHALDAICISFSQNYKYNKHTKRDEIEGLDIHDNEFRELIKQTLDAIIPYPYTNDKPFKGNTKPLETIYGYRCIDNKHYITQRVSLETIEQKDKKIKCIVDEVIKNDLLEKIKEKMPTKDWTTMLQNYIHPTKQTKVKKILVIVSEGELTKDSNAHSRIGEYADFGTKGTKHQFKHSKGHKGQILYYNEKGIIKVLPIYANQKDSDVKSYIEQNGCKLYKKGMKFYSGCLIQINKDFEATAYYTQTDENGNDKPIPTKEKLQAGVYKLRTMMIDGTVKLESSTGIEILTSAKVLVEADFSKFSKY